MIIMLDTARVDCDRSKLGVMSPYGELIVDNLIREFGDLI